MMKDRELRDLLIEGATSHLENFSREATAVKTMREYVAVAGIPL
jgi:hypothetical protein